MPRLARWMLRAAWSQLLVGVAIGAAIEVAIEAALLWADGIPYGAADRV